MAESKIVFSTFTELPEPFNKIARLKTSTRDGGRHSTSEFVDLPEGISPEAVGSLGNKLVSWLRMEKLRIEKEKADAAEAKRKAAEEKQARLVAEGLAADRRARREHFESMITNRLRKPVSFDAASMWQTRDKNFAARIAAENLLEFIGTGNNGDTTYVFGDPQHIGDNICPKCLKPSLHRGKVSTNYGTRQVQCSSSDCYYHEHEYVGIPEPRRGAAIVGVQATPGARF